MANAIAPGRVLGRYRIDSELGTGGMGSVFRAYDVLLRRDVALKVLTADRTRAPTESRARLLREARAAAALRHPSAVAVFDVGEHEGTTFIAMEVVEGRSLRTTLGEAVPIEKRLRWLASIADVLAAAHKAGLVHRDIKPENVMVCPNGTVKVLDFGIAKRAAAAPVAPAIEESAGPGSYRTAEGRVIGTPKYMAPEQWDSGEIDGRADQYAWGLVACELLCGGHPRIVDLGDLLRDGAKAGVPPSVLETIARTLCSRPEDRFASMEEIVDRLAPLATPAAATSEESLGGAMSIGEATADPAPGGGDTVVDGAPTRAQNIQPPARRARPRWIASTAALLLVASGALLVRSRLVTTGAHPPIARTAIATPSRIAVLPLADAGIDPEHAYLADELTDEIIGELSRAPAVPVLAYASVMHYRGTQEKLPDVASELGVSSLVTGSLRIANGNLVLVLELVDGSTQATRWSHTSTHPANELPSVAAEASRDLRTALGVDAGAPVRHTPSSDAYAAYLRGRYLADQRTPAAISKAIESFEQAIALDPAYAEAYVGIATAYDVKYSVSGEPREETEPFAKQAIDKALALDPTSSNAHVAEASLLENFPWDRAGAEREYRRAIELDPRNVLAHQWFGSMLCDLGRYPEGIAENERAMEIDPVNVPLLNNYGGVLFFARRYDDAETMLRHVIDLNPRQPFAHLYLGFTLAEKGRHDDALAEVGKVDLDVPAPLQPEYRLVAETYVAARTGRADAAAKLGRAFEVSKGPPMPVFAATVEALVGQPEKMYAAMEVAVSQHAPWTTIFNEMPAFDAYRSEPHFRDLLRRAGLAPP